MEDRPQRPRISPTISRSVFQLDSGKALRAICLRLRSPRLAWANDSDFANNLRPAGGMLGGDRRPGHRNQRQRQLGQCHHGDRNRQSAWGRNVRPRRFRGGKLALSARQSIVVPAKTCSRSKTFTPSSSTPPSPPSASGEGGVGENVQLAPRRISRSDGVLNRDSDDFIRTPSSWRCSRASVKAVKRLNDAGICDRRDHQSIRDRTRLLL